MDEIIDVIEENYDLKVLSIDKNKNVYKLNTNKGLKCLKVSKYDMEQFKFIFSCISYLLEKSFPSVLSFMDTEAGDKFIKLNNGYGFLCDWINAREASFKNPIELKMCVNTLSNMHLCSRGFKVDGSIKGRNLYGKWIRKFQKRYDELLYFKALIKSKDKLSEFDNIYLKYFEEHYKQAFRTINNLEKSSYQSISERDKNLGEFCHHDTANHNFLIADDMKIYMIDFDYCVYDTHLHDLSSIIIRNLRYGNWCFETMDYILGIYSENINVSKEDLKVIYCFLQFPQDFWQVGLQYYIEKQPWDDAVFMKKLKRVTEDSEERFEFIDELSIKYNS